MREAKPLKRQLDLRLMDYSASVLSIVLDLPFTLDLGQLANA